MVKCFGLLSRTRPKGQYQQMLMEHLRLGRTFLNCSWPEDVLGGEG